MTIGTLGSRARAGAAGAGRRALDAIARRRAAASAARTGVIIPAEPRPTSRSLPTLAEPERLRFSGAAFIVVGALLLGLVVQFAGVSQISYQRDQQLALQELRYQLANGTAPVAQVGQDGRLLAAGTPVALLEIPALGASEVVLEGTTSGTTVSGPGHRRDTVLPGQQGASVVYGRQSAYGAPFAGLSTLEAGDEITATTGQGIATYTVTDVRYPGDPVPDALTAGQGRLSLVSGSGLPFLPQSIVRVDAELTSQAQSTPTRVLTYAVLSDAELTMAGDSSAWPLLVIGLLLLLLVMALVTLSRRYWGTWQTWIVAVPALFAVGLLCARQVALLLPNLM